MATEEETEKQIEVLTADLLTIRLTEAALSRHVSELERELNSRQEERNQQGVGRVEETTTDPRHKEAAAFLATIE